MRISGWCEEIEEEMEGSLGVCFLNIEVGKHV